ncbi:MAG: MMPL family transporter [Sulfurimonadaceae bacterium]|nr:MMPL family transporter [Sulfurimonadaceae bacterium]
MLSSFYDRVVLNYPRLTLILVFLTVVILGTQAIKVEIDASSETLLLKEDKDLAFTREVNKRYFNPDFLVITYQPEKELLDDATLDDIDLMSDELEALEMIDSVVSLLNVPLLQSPPKPLADLIADIPSLKTPGIDRELVRKELLNSPIYSNNLVSPDFKTTAVLVYFKDDPRYFELLHRRNDLLTKEDAEGLSKEERKELKEVRKAFKAHRDVMRERNHQTIIEVREVMSRYNDRADLFLGGVNMIADDMVTYVKSDLSTYGIAVLLLLVVILYIVFRQKRYILLPVLIAILSVIATTGVLGLFGWEVTVISSNFISLQLIVTMSLAIHLSVRYRELVRLNPDAEHRDVIRDATVSMFKPCLYVILTTVAGFSSLVASNILPVMNLGWMMSAGISISLFITFLVFPAVMMLTRKEVPYRGFERHFELTKKLGHIAEKYPRTIIITSVALAIFSISGASKLIVENSFINYFNSDTEIYKGMEVIDTSLGGTTPLDVIIDFPKDETAAEAPKEEFGDGEFDDFEAEFAEDADAAQYWFTAEKMRTIEAIHDYLDGLPETGKTLSFATMLKSGRIINEGDDLDNLELALIYNELPDQFRSIILDPYLDVENDQVRFSVRIVDSQEDLRRDELLKRIQRELHEKVGIPEENIRLAGMMLLYNNMLQSLFNSQIVTLGLVVMILGFMFFILFRSLKVAFIAMIADVIAVGVVFGFMGWAGIPLDMMTITIAAISLGIAVDDAIHYLHRFKIEVAKDGNYIHAMHHSHGSIGYAMYYTTMAIIVGFSVLVLSNFTPTIYFGMLTVLAMFMALIANLLLLPRLIIWIKPFPAPEEK